MNRLFYGENLDLLRQHDAARSVRQPYIQVLQVIAPVDHRHCSSSRIPL